MLESWYKTSTTGLKMVVSLSCFPKALRVRLGDALTEHAGLWHHAAWDAFKTEDAVYLRVALEVGDQPFHLYLHQDGEVLQFEAPLVHDFPTEASSFVLSELCGRNTLMSFRVDFKPSPTLYAWGRLEFDTFMKQHTGFMPYLVIRLKDAKIMLREFLGGVEATQTSTS